MVWYILLCVVILILGYSTLNLLLKYEKIEQAYLDRTSEYELLIEQTNELSVTITNIDIRLKELDVRGSFESDDEIGFFFKEIKQLNGELQKQLK